MTPIGQPASILGRDNYIVNTMVHGADYFTGMERMDFADEAVGDLL